MSRRGGLGRGLAALIPPAPTEESETGDGRPSGPPTPPPLTREPSASDRVITPGSSRTVTTVPAPTAPLIAASAATMAEVSPSHIVPNPRQPREVFDEDEIQGLAASLLDIGMLQPLVVRPADGGSYELIAGERRLRAARLAGLDTVPVVVRHTDDANLLKEALVENIHRVQLNPLEEAAAYQQLLEEFGVTQEELATRLGKSRPAISNALRLMNLPSAVQRRVAAGGLSAGHAKALLAIGDATAQTKLADRIVAEGISVRGTEELVRLRLLGEGSGDTPDDPRPARQRKVTAPGLVDLQEDLSDALMARVRISMGARRGKLSIEFDSVDDLERIVAVVVHGLEHPTEPADASAD